MEPLMKGMVCTMARRGLSLLRSHGKLLLFAAGFAALTMLAFLQGGAGAQTTPQGPTQGIAGTWQGLIHAGIDLHVLITISRAESGGYKALFYGIDQRDAAVPPNSITFQGGTVKWTITAGGSYVGEMSADGNTIEGNWSLWGPTPFPVTLTRVAPETAKKMVEELSRPPAPAANLSLAFEVASIRPSRPSEYMSIRPRADGISITGLSLRGLVFNAYNVPGMSMISKDNQVLGLPVWARSDLFDVEAKIGDDCLAALQKLPLKEQFRQRQFMLQALLADRFKLRIHRETKEMPIYVLIVAKGGPKLKESQAGAYKWMSSDGRFNITAGRIDDLALGLSGEVDRIVTNKTGLTGKYDMALEWTPDEQQGTADAGPSLFTALQEQLGLKLESQKGPVDTIVIDHVETPSEN
jgi:uncharacterized protein (TIGR03435 family)